MTLACHACKVVPVEPIIDLIQGDKFCPYCVRPLEPMSAAPTLAVDQKYIWRAQCVRKLDPAEHRRMCAARDAREAQELLPGLADRLAHLARLLVPIEAPAPV